MNWFGKLNNQEALDSTHEDELRSEADKLAKAIKGRLCGVVLDHSQTDRDSSLPVMTLSCQVFHYPRNNGEHPHQVTLAMREVRVDVTVDGGRFEQGSFSTTLDPLEPHSRSVTKSQEENDETALEGEMRGKTALDGKISSSSVPTGTLTASASASGGASASRKKTTKVESEWTEPNSRFTTFHLDNKTVETTASCLDGEPCLNGKLFDDVLSRLLFDDDADEMRVLATPSIHQRDLIADNQSGVFKPSKVSNKEKIAQIIATKIAQKSMRDSTVVIPRPGNEAKQKKK